MSSLQETPKGERIHIAFFGRRNAGKSTLINALTRQSIALVSAVPGTTTDPVFKAMEIVPLGPVMIVDTAGIDDEGELGMMRVEKTKKIFAQTDIACLVVNTRLGISAYEIELEKELAQRNVPTVIVLHQIEADAMEELEREAKEKWPAVSIVTVNGKAQTGMEALMTALAQCKPQAAEEEISILDGVVEAGDTVLLITPIDGSAPKGRMILPQVQVIRAVMDKNAHCIVAQPEEIPNVLRQLKRLPHITITDSQAFGQVNALLPASCPLTSFSILMARYKGDLKELAAGAAALRTLQPGDKVLIAEGCTHRRQCEDIGTVKIPNWLRKNGFDVQFTWTSGTEYPEDLSSYKLIIHCGGCMLHRREMLRRLEEARLHHIPIVNYGVLIAKLHGILDRALSPFLDELK